MRFARYFAAALAFAAASAQDYQGQPMPVGGLTLNAPGYTLKTPGLGWVLRTRVAPLTSGMRVGNPDGAWFFEHPASGSEIYVQTVRWDSNWWGNLDAYMRSQIPATNRPRVVSLNSRVLKGARCAGLRTASGGAWSLHREICLHPEHPGFAVDVQFKPGQAGLEREGLAVMDSLTFAPIGYRVREFHPSCDVKGIAASGGSFWISCSDSSSGYPGVGTVLRVDPANNGVLVRIPVDAQPGRITAAYGSIWVPSFAASTLTRIDPRTNAVTGVFRLPMPVLQVVAAGGALWAPWASGDPASFGFLRIDPASGVVTQRVPLDAPAVQLTATENGLYFLPRRGGRLMRLDPATGGVTSPLAVAETTMLMRSDGRNVWLSGADANGPYLARLDPARPELAPAMARRTPERAFDVAEWNGATCILAAQSVQCDGRGGFHEVPLQAGLATHLHVAAGALWVEDDDSATVLRIDAR